MSFLRSFLFTVPLFIPALVISAVLGALLARGLGQRLGTSPVVAFVLIMSLGLIVAATLTPFVGGDSTEQLIGGGCDLSRLGFAPVGTLLRPNDASLNILLFVPLGLSVGLLPRAGTWTVIVLAAFALPVLVEATQSLVTALGRGCESADVIDNALGLAIGLVLGVSLSTAARRLERSRAVR